MAPGQIATLILPADTAWTEADGVAETPETPQPQKPANEAVVAAAKALKSGQSAMLFIGGRALRAQGLELAGKIAAKTGCKVQGAGGTARIERGAGRVPVLRLHFVIENAQAQLKGTKQMVLCGAKAPQPSSPIPASRACCRRRIARSPRSARSTAIRWPRSRRWRPSSARLNEKPAGVAQPSRPDRPTGKFTLEGLGQALGATMPEGAIVVDESVTTGRGFFPFSAGAPPHDWLNNMGGSIGFGGPVARRRGGRLP